MKSQPIDCQLLAKMPVEFDTSKMTGNDILILYTGMAFFMNNLDLAEEQLGSLLCDDCIQKAKDMTDLFFETIEHLQEHTHEKSIR